MSRVECFKLLNVSANIAFAIVRVNFYWEWVAEQERADIQSVANTWLSKRGDKAF
jgi:hypothetical protein